MRRRGTVAVLAIAALLLVAAPARAADFNVNRFDDPAAGASCPANCSLRAAFLAAQANGATADDQINVPAGTYVLTSTLNMPGNATTRITIAGAGANSTFIEPVAATPAGFRVLTLADLGQVTVRDVTLRNGRSEQAAGGNVLAPRSSQLTLIRVRVTGGQGANGGGIAGEVGSRIEISNSVIDTNAATTSAGGVLSNGELTITDSTVAFNRGASIGGIAVTGATAPLLRRVTLAYNASTNSQTPGAGGIQANSAGATIQGSIIAANTLRQVSGSTQQDVTYNCAFAVAVTDQGGNVEDQDQCGLSAASLRNTNPQIATTLDETAQPPGLPIAATSLARDRFDCGTLAQDQRGTPRPQGPLCDAGAYEYDAPPITTIQTGGPPFTFAASETVLRFECSLDDGPFITCVPPYSPIAPPGRHTLAVRAVDTRGNTGSPATVAFDVAQPRPQATPAPLPTATPTPVVNKTVVVKKIKGTVKVKLKGTNTFIDLDVAKGIPVGSTVDARRGTVELTSVPAAGAPAQTAKFWDGIFTVTQARGITTLKLVEALAACPKAHIATAAAKKPTKRRLWGDGKGAFRTAGKYSAATVRGTKWLVQDSCAGTLTRVTQGAVSVRDNVRRRTILRRKGQTYLARPKH